MDYTNKEIEDDLDAFFNAADASRPGAIRIAARKISQNAADSHREDPEPPDAPPAAAEQAEAPSLPRPDDESATSIIRKLAQAVEATNEHPKVDPEPEPVDDPEYGPEYDPEYGPDSEPESVHRALPKDLEGKFIVVDSKGGTDDPFVLIPANIHNYVPWWGWLTIGLGLLILIAGVVLTPMLSLDRLVSRLGDGNEANVRNAMRQIVIKGNGRTVEKLYSVATSDKQGITARLRAVDAMSLIERVPEVDNALLRLELSADTNQRVREAAIAARKQREAYKTRTRTFVP